MITLHIIVLAAIILAIIAIHEVLRADILEEENKELKEEIRGLKNEARNCYFSFLPKSWIINELDNIIKDIEFEISKRPNHANIGKYGCLKLITILRNKI